MKDTTLDLFINNVSREELVTALQSIKTNPAYSTKPIYHGGAEVSFIDFHLSFLKEHPVINPADYLNNLRLMLKKRN